MYVIGARIKVRDKMIIFFGTNVNAVYSPDSLNRFSLNLLHPELTRDSFTEV